MPNGSVFCCRANRNNQPRPPAACAHRVRSTPIKSLLVALLSGTLLLTTPLSRAEDAPPAIRKSAPILEARGSDPLQLRAVKAQNSACLSLEAIKARDASWRDTAGVDDFMRALMANAAAAALQQFERSQPDFTERCLMDDRGANLAMTSTTSDYGQGGEANGNSLSREAAARCTWAGRI